MIRKTLISILALTLILPVMSEAQWQGNNYSGADYNIMAVADYNILEDTVLDTVNIHSMIQIDDHLVIQDTVLITQTIKEIQRLNQDAVNSKDLQTKIVSLIAIALVILSFINHYIKRKKNG